VRERRSCLEYENAKPRLDEQASRDATARARTNDDHIGQAG
jgi:hypothetical protein